MKFDKPLHMNILIQYPATLLAVLLPTTVNAQLILVPHEIDVKDVMQPRQVRLTHNGEAVLPSEILSVSSGVFKTGEALPKNAARNPQGVVVSQWSDTTNIIEAISTTVRKGYQVPFSAPSGYSHVSWSLNDKIIAEKHLERSNRYTQFVTFRNKGRNTLTCLASDSETGDFRRITWSAEVQ